MICPMCGSPVTVHSAEEGTNCYQPAVSEVEIDPPYSPMPPQKTTRVRMVDPERLEKLEEVAKAADKLCGRSSDGFTSVRWRELVEALQALEGKG